ncbi:DUF1971 domain-containing protein [Parasphingorhabdus sp.]|uniref:DUF1971 domain-containing protein n=1 Tax=Parasphingorhabdus sp. TaxID=2709688 RepID=UPI003265C18E
MMPKKAEPYSSTPIFNETSLPKALQNAHNTKAGTWGLLDLIAGELVYVIEDSGNRRPMVAGDRQLIEPEQLHHVELSGPMQMQVHFYRDKPDLK